MIPVYEGYLNASKYTFEITLAIRLLIGRWEKYNEGQELGGKGAEKYWRLEKVLWEVVGCDPLSPPPPPYDYIMIIPFCITIKLENTVEIHYTLYHSLLMWHTTCTRQGNLISQI